MVFDRTLLHAPSRGDDHVVQKTFKHTIIITWSQSHPSPSRHLATISIELLLIPNIPHRLELLVLPLLLLILPLRFPLTPLKTPTHHLPEHADQFCSILKTIIIHALRRVVNISNAFLGKAAALFFFVKTVVEIGNVFNFDRETNRVRAREQRFCKAVGFGERARRTRNIVHVRQEERCSGRRSFWCCCVGYWKPRRCSWRPANGVSGSWCSLARCG